MPIDAQCGSCTARYKVVDTAAGRRVKCRRCGTSIDLPGEAAPPDPFAVLAQLEKNAPAAAIAPEAALIHYRAVMSTVTAPVASGPTKKHGTSINDLQPGGANAPGSRKRKQGGGGFRLPGGPIIPMVAGGIILLLVVLSLVIPVCAVALFALGCLFMLSGSLWGLFTAYRENSLCGMLYTTLPFYPLYYLLTRWEEMKFPFLAGIIGFGLTFLAIFLGAASHLPFAQAAGQ